MSLASDISAIKHQEAALHFEKFDEADAWRLGQGMRALAEAKNYPFVIDIRIGGRQMFFTSLPGSAPDNFEWARRKANSVMRYHASSYRLGLEIKSSGKSLGEARGVDLMHHADAGGGFPIHVIGTGVVGSITVSGVPQREDHEFVVEAICQYLSKNYSELALPPESA
jgi:uncharacterized protein (UPF0303 family)